MASLRREIGGLRRLLGAAAALACAALCALTPGVARADEAPVVSVVAVEGSTLGSTWQSDVAAGSAAQTLPRVTPTMLDVACDPDTIQVGVSCGMDWMCGIKPCLCGSADHWGGCSCNGLVDESPQVTWESSDEDVVRVTEAFGRTWLVPVGAGQATLTATPTLSYHDGVAASMTVSVDGPQVADGIAVALVAGVVAVVVALCLAIRRFVRNREGLT